MKELIMKILDIFLHRKKLKKGNASWYQLFKFIAVGVSNNIVFYITYILLIMIKINYLFANIIAFFVSTINAFYWSNKYVFRSATRKKGKIFLAFIKMILCYSITGVILNNILLVLWIEFMGVHEMIAPLINLILTVPINFLLNKFWVFGDRGEAVDEA